MAVFLGMMFLLVRGAIAVREWKEIALRFFLIGVGFLIYLLSGVSDTDLGTRVARPLAELGERPYLWASVAPAAAGLFGAWLLMRAVKASDRRPSRGILLIGPVVMMVFAQLVLPTLLQLAVLDLEVLVPGVAFGGGLVFYIAFIEDWRTTRFGFLDRIGRLFRRRKPASAGDQG